MTYHSYLISLSQCVHFFLCSDPDCRFSYTNSVLWKNKKYNKDLITVLNHDLPLFGGAQLRRILWEFQLCVLIVRFPAVSSAELRQRLASERYGFQAQGSQCVPWGTVVCINLR